MTVIRKTVKYLFTFLLAVIYLTPFYILVTYALRKVSDTRSKWTIPDYLYLDNFINVFNKGNILNAIKNNVIITVVSLVLIIFVASIAAYPLARIKSRLNKIIYMVIIAFMIVPPLSILVPLYRIMIDIGGINTHWGIILLHVTFNLPLSIFLYTGSLNSISVQLDEAAVIDGCNRISLFFRIIFPLLKNVTVTVCILVGVGVWNDYQFSAFFLESSSMFTPTKALSQFVSQFGTELGMVAAGCIISMLPILILYFLMQKQFMSGSVAGAVKG